MSTPYGCFLFQQQIGSHIEEVEARSPDGHRCSCQVHWLFDTQVKIGYLTTLFNLMLVDRCHAKSVWQHRTAPKAAVLALCSLHLAKLLP